MHTCAPTHAAVVGLPTTTSYAQRDRCFKSDVSRGFRIRFILIFSTEVQYIMCQDAGESQRVESRRCLTCCMLCIVLRTATMFIIRRSVPQMNYNYRTQSCFALTTATTAVSLKQSLTTASLSLVCFSIARAQLAHEGHMFRSAVLPPVQPEHEAGSFEGPRDVGTRAAGPFQRQRGVHASSAPRSLQPGLRSAVSAWCCLFDKQIAPGYVRTAPFACHLTFIFVFFFAVSRNNILGNCARILQYIG